MIEALGLPDMPSLREHGQFATLKSDEQPLGWAVFNQDLGFGRHLVFEIGDDKNHIRLNIKDSWCGDDFKVQIDEMTLWDRGMTYSIPCREFDHWVEMGEDILGTIDITVQALCNEDDAQAYNAFQDIERFKIELLKVVTPQSMLNKTSIKPNP